MKDSVLREFGYTDEMADSASTLAKALVEADDYGLACGVISAIIYTLFDEKDIPFVVAKIVDMCSVKEIMEKMGEI